jgi:hypothetical protein
MVRLRELGEYVWIYSELHGLGVYWWFLGMDITESAKRLFIGQMG